VRKIGGFGGRRAAQVVGREGVKKISRNLILGSGVPAQMIDFGADAYLF
jgi:hypothetical protein